MRKPVYAKGNKYRIISLPNEQWECQRWVGRLISADATRVNSWEPTHRPTDRAEALRQLSIFGEVERSHGA